MTAITYNVKGTVQSHSPKDSADNLPRIKNCEAITNGPANATPRLSDATINSTNVASAGHSRAIDGFALSEIWASRNSPPTADIEPTKTTPSIKENDLPFTETSSYAKYIYKCASTSHAIMGIDSNLRTPK